MNDHSIIFLNPTKVFWDWVELMSSIDPWKRCPKDIYSDIEAVAWLAPKVEEFGSSKEFREYIALRKPSMLRLEVRRVHKGEANFPYEYTEEIFDRCFKMTVIHYLDDISRLSIRED